jgi:hypothetical protein
MLGPFQDLRVLKRWKRRLRHRLWEYEGWMIAQLMFILVFGVLNCDRDVEEFNNM